MSTNGAKKMRRSRDDSTSMRRLASALSALIGGSISAPNGYWSSLLVVLSIGFLISACSPGGTSPTTTATPSTTVVETTTTDPRPKYDYGGEVLVGVEDQPTTLNPFVPNGDSPVVAMIGQSYLSGVYEMVSRLSWFLSWWRSCRRLPMAVLSSMRMAR